ncbi:MAG: ribose-phosphate pyrophosphokinase [Candidatus Pacebacteria bacterium]|nr:ribose-phosphate pyrophosphokinase [Candidatus Paceibacterota bacterium]
MFGRQLATQLSVSFGNIELGSFPNGERRVWIQSSVINEDAILVQSFSTPVDMHVLEFSLLADAAERAGAKTITAVIPWMGYSLQDKVFRQGEPIAARVIADIVSGSRIDRVMVMDLHSNSVAGFFSVPTTVLSSWDLFVDDVKNRFRKEESIVVSPDFGGLKRAHVFAERLGVSLANIDKARDLHTGKVQAKFMVGEVKKKICLVVDDVINTGSTVVEIARLLKEHGAKKVVFYSTHALLAGSASTLLQESAVDEVVVGDTVAVGEKMFPKLRVLSVVPVFAEAIHKMM